MSPREPFDDHREAFRRELRRVTAPRPVRRRRGLLALAGTTIAVAAGVTAALVFAPSNSRLDVLAEAQAALAAPQTILHYAVKVSTKGVPAVDEQPDLQRCESGPPELWRTTSGPLRYRMRTPIAPCAIGLGGGRVTTGRTDYSYADHTLKNYAVDDDWMQVTTDVPDGRGRVPDLFFGDQRLTRGQPQDPVVRIRELLAGGKLRDTGLRPVEQGRTLVQLVGHYTETVRGLGPHQPVDVAYELDARTFAPVTIQTTHVEAVTHGGADGHRLPTPIARPLTVYQRFTVYERIPLTPETEHLLTATPAPGTQITTQTEDELMRKLAATRRRGQIEPVPRAEMARAQRAVKKQQAAGLRRKGDRW